MELLQYQNLMDNIGCGLLILNKNFQVLSWNRWFEQHSSLDISDYKNQNLFDIFPEIKDSRVQDAIELTSDLGYPSIVSNIFSPFPFPLYNPKKFFESQLNDERIQQFINTACLDESSEKYCLLQISDVTAAVNRETILKQEVAERKEIENALLESEIKNLTIFEKMVDGLIVFNGSGFIESYNPACKNIFLMNECDALGKNIHSFFEGDLLLNHRDGNIQINNDYIGTYNEIAAVRPDDTLLEVELSISIMPIANKQFYSALIRDISARKQVEKMKTEFISTVSHELRTPLTSIRGSLGLIAGGAIDSADEKAKELIDIAYHNCDRLILLINDILDMEKANAGNMQFDIQKNNIIDLVKSSINDNQSYADLYKVDYKLDTDLTSAVSEIDAHRFQQIMANLLSNAAKFSNSNDLVNIRVLSIKNNIHVEVQDYGKGIPVIFQEKIWNKFTQADASTTREKGGTGLGLAISRKLVQSMNGEISFNSVEGEGTTFVVAFPRCA